MAESRKRRSSEPDYEDLTVYFTGKRPRTTSEMLMFDDDDDDDEEEELMMITSEEEDLLAVGFPIEEEMVKQVMKVLEEELRSPNKKLFQTSSSSSSPSASYFTINNYNEESCGPSISDSSSSVMASMDIGSINIAYLLSFSEYFWNNSLILPAASTNVDQLIFPHNEQQQVSVNQVVEIINGGVQKDQEEEEEEGEEENVDEWINRVLNGDLLEFDDDDDDDDYLV